MINVKVLSLGTGNTGSVINAFSALSYPASLLNKPADIVSADLLVLPGVGSARIACEFINDPEIREFLNIRNQQHKPTIGICLGAQIMFDYLDEAKSSGLGWMAGPVTALDDGLSYNNGWCHLNWLELANFNLARAVTINDTFYFNHQYRVPKNTDGMVVSVKEIPSVPAMIIYRHLCAIQFHPEKSQKAGQIVLRNILEDYFRF
jgi:glutamine amidotransferase